MTPKFSVIVPLYNKALYVRHALESIAAQTFRDYEVIVVDDGSTDNSLEVVSGLKIEDRRLKILTQSNSGVAVARNNGVTASKGEYVCFLDADDWWEVGFLKAMDDAIKQYPQAGLYATSYNIVRNSQPWMPLKGMKAGVIDYFKSYYFNSYAMPVWTGAVCIPRKVFEKLGGFNPMLKMAEDFDLWVRIALKYPVYFINQPLANYNQDVQVKWRAIGKLVDPKHHFVFHSDYLKPYEEKNADVRHVVDMVRIACLKQYYLSRKYHSLAEKELKKIDIDQYRDKDFASYLWQPLWKERMRFYLNAMIKMIKNR